MAVNMAVPILYPKLGAKFGNYVTYEEAPREHLMVEFGFDVVQVAAGLYAPNNYHDFIGFNVSKPLLERAFKETYGLDVKDVLLAEDLALATYRYAAGKTIPHLTAVAWQLKRDQIEKLIPGITRRKFVYRFSRRDYASSYGKTYRGRGVTGHVEGYEHRLVVAAHTPGVGARILAIIFTIIPRFGPLRALDFKPATPRTERMFLASLKATRANYRHLVEEAGCRPPQPARPGSGHRQPDLSR